MSNKTIINEIDVSNCEYLSQENEELKHQIEDVDTLCSEKESLIDKLAKKSQRLTSENRELEQKNEELKTKIKELLHECNSCKFYQYKQALDEIEEFCTVYSNNHDTYETIYKHILNIINKK